MFPTFSFLFFFQRSFDHRDLHSFPTRRSSDLDRLFNVQCGGVFQEGLLVLCCVLLNAETGLRRVVDDLVRSEEHTSELQSPMYLVCRLLLEKKKIKMKLFRVCY